MSAKSADPPPAGGREALRGVAHDLGNLASRLTLLSENLKDRIGEPEARDEAVALLEDTTVRLRLLARRIREVAPDV